MHPFDDIFSVVQLQTLEIEIQRRKEALKEENKKRKEETKQVMGSDKSIFS